MIRKIDVHSDFISLARLLNEAFATVAKEFGLTEANCPTHNAFIAGDTLQSQLTENRAFYSYEDGGRPVGFIAIEKSLKEPDTFYIEKVAVHPHYRHRGTGTFLMNFAMEQIAKSGGKRISVGLINNHTRLKNWYYGQGFRAVEIKSFEHLPFDVCLMKKELLKTENQKQV
ncbi:MAG: GNAT family N-acetyltransferase [Tannerella sp.]|jgi:ribosomal protein S18 acetylase RimI-like enzyme|nr:GNAT family N-acetyltransferase [Tannerella sp.]